MRTALCTIPRLGITLAALGIAGCQPSTPRATPAPVVRPDSVAFAPLAGTVRDCPPAATPTVICRLRLRADSDQLRRLAATTPVLHHGDTLTFAYRGEAREVLLQGGIQLPMSRVVGTDLWTVSLLAPGTDRAVISYLFFPITDAPPAGSFRFSQWRGPNAPPAPPRSAALHGTLRRDTIASAQLGTRRGLTVYVPPARGSDPISAVVYMADGQEVAAMAPSLDTMIVSGQLPRVLLVGVHSSHERLPEPYGDARTAEYLRGVGDDVRFKAHERFVLEEVMPWTERTLGAPTVRTRRAVYGFSNGGAWAIDMGLRHQDLFGYVFGFSPAGVPAALPAGPSSAMPAFYLAAGEYELNFIAKARAWAALFEKAGVRHELRPAFAGHDNTMWGESFLHALTWAFPK